MRNQTRYTHFTGSRVWLYCPVALQRYHLYCAISFSAYKYIGQYVILIWGGLFLWPLIRAAAPQYLWPPCHGSVLIPAGMKVTEDDRQPNAFPPAADFFMQTPRFRQMGAGEATITTRSTFSLRVCDVAWWWSCQTLHARPCLPLSRSHSYHLCY